MNNNNDNNNNQFWNPKKKRAMGESYIKVDDKEIAVTSEVAHMFDFICRIERLQSQTQTHDNSDSTALNTTIKEDISLNWLNQ